MIGLVIQNRLVSIINKSRSILRNEGALVLLKKISIKMLRMIRYYRLRKAIELIGIRRRPQDQYQQWLRYRIVTDRVRGLIKSDIAQFNRSIKFSIVMPVYNPPLPFLDAAMNSVRAQLYTNWELCICDDGSRPEVISKIIEYSNIDKRIIYVLSETNCGISEATNKALGLSTGEYIGFLDHDDVLDETALYYVAKEINEDHALDILYSDRDHINEKGVRIDPFFKPDWSPNLILSNNYIIHFLVFNKTLLNKTGLLQKKYDGAQDYDFILRLTEQTKSIKHIPRILYSWRRFSGSNSLVPKPYAFRAACDAIQDALIRRNENAIVTMDSQFGPYKAFYPIVGKPRISIIISSCDVAQLERCCPVIEQITSYKNYEIIITTNSLQNEKIWAFCEKHKYKLVEVENGFFSKMNNRAANASCGDILLFLNDDTQVITADWLEEMLSLCQKSTIGAVGPKLIFPDLNIQFTRMVLGIRRDGVPVFTDPFSLYRNQYVDGFVDNVIADVSSVSGACLMIRKEVFDQVGQFNTNEFNIAWQDIDLCFRLRKLGYSIVYTPYSVLIHYGASTKKSNEYILRTDVDQGMAFFEKFKDELVLGDPYYNNNLMDVNSYREIPQFKGFERIDITHVYYKEKYWEEYGFPIFPKGYFIQKRDEFVKLNIDVYCTKIISVTGCKKVVDIGCGTGILVEAFVKCGIDAIGIEFSSSVRRYIPEYLINRIKDINLNSELDVSLLQKEYACDLVVCMEVLEHIPIVNMDDFICKLAHLAGDIVVTTPRPNLWDVNDKTHVSVRERDFWVESFSKYSYRENRSKAEVVFGLDYDLNPDTNLFFFSRTSL